MASATRILGTGTCNTANWHPLMWPGIKKKKTYFSTKLIPQSVSPQIHIKQLCQKNRDEHIGSMSTSKWEHGVLKACCYPVHKHDLKVHWGVQFLISHMLNTEQSCVSPRENISMHKGKQQKGMTKKTQW